MIQKLDLNQSKYPSLLAEKTSASRNKHVQLLEQFLTVLPHILPSTGLSRPAMLHHDLHSDNIFVDDADPTKISSIIDWQAVYASPLFMQARFPSIFDCDGPYPQGAVQPQLPENFNTLSPAEKKLAEDRLSELRLKKFYELASRKFNPLLIKAMDAMRNDDDPTTFIFHIVGQSSTDGPMPIRELLIQIYEKWDRIMKDRDLKIPCPISFSKKEVDDNRQWAEAYGEFESLRFQLLGKEGWVSHEEYDEAMRRWEDNKAKLDLLRERLENVS